LPYQTLHLHGKLASLASKVLRKPYGCYSTAVDFCWFSDDVNARFVGVINEVAWVSPLLPSEDFPLMRGALSGVHAEQPQAYLMGLRQLNQEVQEFYAVFCDLTAVVKSCK
jgi:hypothetical protein